LWSILNRLAVHPRGLGLIHSVLFINDFYFLEFFLKNFFGGVLHQAVRAVSKNRPKYPKLDIPFHSNSLYVVEKKIVGISQYPYFRRRECIVSSYMCCSSASLRRRLCGMARHFKTDPTETVALCFGYAKTLQLTMKALWPGASFQNRSY
jgi:hypothetical protein